MSRDMLPDYIDCLVSIGLACSSRSEERAGGIQSATHREHRKLDETKVNLHYGRLTRTRCALGCRLMISHALADAVPSSLVVFAADENRIMIPVSLELNLRNSLSEHSYSLVNFRSQCSQGHTGCVGPPAGASTVTRSIAAALRLAPCS